MLATKLLNHIAEQFLDGEKDGLEPQTPLFELNIVDSAAIFDLVDYLKQETQLNIGMQEIHPGNFASVDAMVTLVERLQTEQA
ncbi:acyl carrier protein [Pseudoalteromonas rubra]|uniref:Acyl carrier protein n=1 Tax=Pseudoalteromonas rubra TaxID=43658 RepID=A0A5S3WJA7_9GAMM|nr:acyl carrier protein [Pseudoalteromonas rubra]TMP27269.1 acyl carrier protein [Pseudoalteromonas rubra]TMP36807.1 acyl carrier protein [Pseudoalteromonas rubra]